MLEKFYQTLRGHLESRGYLNGDCIKHWVALQAYIMATYMVAYVSYLNIDSCYIEGFNPQEVEKYLNLDTTKERVALIVCFGYRAKQQQERYRLSLDELVEYR